MVDVFDIIPSTGYFVDLHWGISDWFSCLCICNNTFHSIMHLQFKEEFKIGQHTQKL